MLMQVVDFTVSHGIAPISWGGFIPSYAQMSVHFLKVCTFQRL